MTTRLMANSLKIAPGMRLRKWGQERRTRNWERGGAWNQG